MNGELPSTIADAGAWLRSGRLSSVQLTKELLGRIHATQDTLAAFFPVTEDAALAAAERADAELAAGNDRGQLHGSPADASPMTRSA
jgi:aspartyl-tRNA(Asn)/glutamyl-tRNA(Gln) amidotransferase subunit A